MYDEGGDDGQHDAEAHAVEADECVVGRDDAVAVLVEEINMLLEHGLVRVLFRPLIICRTVWLVVCGGEVGAGGALEGVSTVHGS